MGPVKLNPFADFEIVALDTQLFIYFLEGHPVYFPLVKDLFTSIERGEHKATASSLIFTELMVPAYRRQALGQIEEVFRLLTNFPNLIITDLTPQIACEASRIRATFRLRTPDAIHVASAMASKAKALLTNDLDFRNVATELKVLMLRDYSS